MLGLRAKFNLVIIAVFIVGFAITGLLLKSNFEAAEKAEAIQSARVMMSAANAVRHYTNTTILPLIGTERNGRFLEASVPSFAAQASFDTISREFNDYRYKEAALNPTNVADRALDWEADIINNFRQRPHEKELITERDTPVGWSINLARPIIVSEQQCLTCHSQASVAPASLTSLYGTTNGFGWRLGETIGAQIVSLPLSVSLAKAHKTLWVFLGLLTLVFLFMLAVLNVLLHFLVIRPVVTMAKIATEVSLGNMAAEDFDASGKDEISSLGAAFNRMRRSLQRALTMLEETEPA